jgi:hypothetical protein
MATRRVGLTKKHYVSFDAHIATQSTLTAYGKLIEGGESTPTALGVSHPLGLRAALHKSLVFGVQIDGQCIKLPNPEEVALPEPDGRADGCEWDPSEFVVWRNLPRNWTTIHFQSQPKPLISALSLGTGRPTQRFMAAGVATTDFGAQVKSIVETWAHMTAEPAGSAVLQNLWANSDVGGTFALAATNLAQNLNSQLGSHILGTDISNTLTVDQLIAML